MRAFYVDEEDQSKRRYYVKIDNVDVPEDLKGYKAIEADSVEELKKLVMVQYDLNKNINAFVKSNIMFLLEFYKKLILELLLRCINPERK